jgi:uncharacterized protein
MRLKRSTLVFGLCIAVGGVALAFSAHALAPFRGTTATWVREMKVASYAPQRVIYHLDQSAGLLNGHYRHVLQVAQNHVDAVGADKLDLRIIMQSEGVDLLSWAKGNAAAQAAIDRLKKQGVKFQVCRNTLIMRGIDPDTQLYDVKREDIVRAAVGEIAALESQGFQYIKP